MQPDDSICLWPGRLEGPYHSPVKPEWHRMVRARVVEEKE